MRTDGAADGGLKVGDGLEDAPFQPPSGQDREKSFDGIEPGCRARGEVEYLSGMIGEPGLDLGVFVRAVVIEDRVDHLAWRAPRLQRRRGT